MTSETSNPDGAKKRHITSQPGCAKTTEVASDTSTSRTPKINQQPLPNTRDDGPHRFTRSDERKRHHRRRRHLKVLRHRERRSSSLGPRGGHRIPDSSLDEGSQPRGGGTSHLHRPHRQCRENFQGAPFHRRGFWRVANTNLRPLSHEGRWQCLRTTSCRLSEVSDSLRGLGWLAGWFASSCQTPFFWRTG